jgi:Arc/MetJ-type ribon-helix-helix transcriptional regulator
MDLQTHSPAHVSPASTRLEPMLVRLPPTYADRLRQLARSTRIRQSDYLREAVADLLAKYAHLTDEEATP